MCSLKSKFGCTARIAMLLLAVPTFSPVHANGDRIALLFGLEQYGKGIFKKLPSTTHDLEAMGLALKDIGFHEDQIYIYTDAKNPKSSEFEYRPLEKEIEYIIHDWARTVEKNTLFFVYFTGHGGSYKEKWRVLALPQSDRSYPKSFLPVQQILDGIARDVKENGKVNSHTNTILVIDACADNLGNEGEEFFSQWPAEHLPSFFFSSDLLEPSFFDPDKKISVFTKYFVKALKEADGIGYSENHDGLIQFNEVEYYVKKEVKKHGNREPKKIKPARYQKEQNPQSYGHPNLVLGELQGNVSFPKLKQGKSDEFVKARQSGVLRAILGD